MRGVSQVHVFVGMVKKFHVIEVYSNTKHILAMHCVEARRVMVATNLASHTCSLFSTVAPGISMVRDTSGHLSLQSGTEK